MWVSGRQGALGGYSHPHPCVTSGKLLLGKQDRPVDEDSTVSILERKCNETWAEWVSMHVIWNETVQRLDIVPADLLYSVWERPQGNLKSPRDTIGCMARGPEIISDICAFPGQEACDLAYKIFPIHWDQLWFSRRLLEEERVEGRAASFFIKKKKHLIIL